MNKFILPFLTFLFAFHSSAFVGVRAIQGADVDCLTESVPPILDRKNELNFRMIADVKSGSVQDRYSIYDYPKLPDNLDEILKPSKRAVCDTYKVADSNSPSYKSIMSWIDEKYKGGDHKDFFFRYVLTLDCYPFQENFLDSTIEGNGITHAFGNMMKVPFGGIDMNAFVRIKREGKVFEGPLYHVFAHLEKNYKNSENYKKEYFKGMKRLNHPSYHLTEPKSLSQIKRENPDMPINLPMP